MRPRWSGLTCFFAFVLCFQFALALPAETGTSTLTSHSPSSTAEDSRPTRATARTSESRSITPAADDHGDSDDSHSSTQASHRTSSSHSLAIPIPHTHTPHSWSHSLNYTGTHTFLPHPPPTGPVGGSPPRSSHGQSAVAIVFEVLGGAVVLLIVLAIARCWYSYRRTPPRDRIGALLSRHQLEREMEEQQRDRMERINRAMEPYRWRPPPPPYQPAPAYDTVVATDSPEGSIDWGRPSFPSASHPRSPTP